MSIELKIKSKHLTEEAKIIRFEERKQKAKNKPAFWSLRQHRTWDVRNENRATFLARAFLDGRAYKSVEVKIHSSNKLVVVIVPRVLAMVNKYGDKQITREDIFKWIDA
jgi:hypothetical protein